MLSAGRAWPLGASFDGQGVNLAVFSEHAQRIDWCLFDAAGHAQLACHSLPARSGDIWHGYLSGAAPGQLYGLRAHGPWLPAQGLRFNANKLLLDPYAREIVGDFDWHAEHFGGVDGTPELADQRDNAGRALKARIVHDEYDWRDDAPPAVSASRSVFYELNVRSFTKAHAQVPAAQRGTFAGLSSPAALAHLQRLSVTAVCLLPVHHFIDEQRLVGLGLRNLWGYNTLGFFSPQPRYGSAPNGRALRDEFRDMVRALHRAGIEVILDVVFNHTAETDAAGPLLSWRGLDNLSYYRLERDDRSAYVNHTGCGNTLNLDHVRVQQMVLDSLRYWVQHMHVDGFRFDLATVLGRTRHDFDRHAPFFASLAQDPVLAGVKLVAEPWDLGPHGYQLGQFPTGWLEWNDRFRDTVRAFWLHGPSTRGAFAHRLCASAGEFRHRLRAPAASVNYVVAHDGYSLHDLVSYEQRHNEANGEGNGDGHQHNLSWNCGAEGPSSDAAVLRRRALLQRALLATTLLAQGTPMLAAGAELGHSQQGNNNAYCQDNEIGWIDWQRADTELIEFTARLIGVRQRLAPLGDAWFDAGSDLPDSLHWFAPDGTALHADDWNRGDARTLGLRIDRRARTTLLVLFNAGDAGVHFALPEGSWQIELDTAIAAVDIDERSCLVGAHGIVLLGSTDAATAQQPQP